MNRIKSEFTKTGGPTFWYCEKCRAYGCPECGFSGLVKYPTCFGLASVDETSRRTSDLSEIERDRIRKAERRGIRRVQFVIFAVALLILSCAFIAIFYNGPNP